MFVTKGVSSGNGSVKVHECWWQNPNTSPTHWIWSTMINHKIMANPLRMQVCLCMSMLFLPSNSSSAIWLTSGLVSDLKTITCWLCWLYIDRHWNTKLEHQFLDSGAMSVSTTERNLTMNIPIYPITECRLYWERERSNGCMLQPASETASIIFSFI